MKIKIQQFLFGKSHSWSVTGKGLARSFLNKGLSVDLVSTDGLVEKFIDNDLRPFVATKIDNRYDLEVSYTAPKNFPIYLNRSNNRFGIWNYEFDHIPTGFSKYINSIDKFLPSSKWFYDICLKNGIKEDKMCVVPHGIDYVLYDNVEPLKLDTKKSIKLLMNIAQPHIRKNIPKTLEVYGKAFNKKDDVCLVIKVVDKKPEMSFDLCFSDIFKKFKAKYPDHAEIIVLKDYIPNIGSLYKACDILFMLPNAEAFHLPSLEALYCGLVVINSNYGGQLDFLSDKNSILVNGKMIRAPKEAQYWIPNTNSSMFEPDMNEAVDKLRYVVNNLSSVKNGLTFDKDLFNKFSWENATNIILGLKK